MKLRQKLAMLMAATMITTTFPTLTSALTKNAIATQAIVMYNTFNYSNPTTSNKAPDDKKAINMNISNNNSDGVIDGRTTPQQFHLKGIDIKFSNSIFTPTKGVDNLPGPDNTDKLSNYKVDGKSLLAHMPYALVDYSKNNNIIENSKNAINEEKPTPNAGRIKGYTTNNAGNVTEVPADPRNPNDYADRIFVIDPDGNYTSYVSMRYAMKDKVNYVTTKNSTSGTYFKSNTIYDITEAYLFQKVISEEPDPNDVYPQQREIYINKVPNDANTDFETNNELYMKSFNPKKLMEENSNGIISPADDHNGGATDADATKTDFSKLNYKTVVSEDDQIAEVYLKEFTLFRDSYGSDTLLDGEFYQILQRNYDNNDLYIPIAFTLTGKAPFIEIIGSEFSYSKLKLQSKIITDLVDYRLKQEGQLSTNAKGDLGIFEIFENKLNVFGGDFPDPDEISLKGGSNGVFLFELDDDDLKFDLRKGDKLWNRRLGMQTPNEQISDEYKGKLFDYIQFTSGLRGFEEHIQVEVLDVQDNQMVVRITDETNRVSPDPGVYNIIANRKHEGGIEFCQLPIEVNRKTTLPLGDIKVTITQIDPDSLEDDGDRVGDLDFDDADTVEETFVIAEVRDENMRIEALQEATVLTGQDSATVEIALRELVDDTLDIRDEFYMKIINGAMETDINEIWFYLDGIPIQNKEADHIFEKDGSEYVLDIDSLYDAWIKQEKYDENDSIDQDIIKREWERILDEITFDFKLRADLNATTGDIKLAIESDNLKNHNEEIIIGEVKKSFSYTAPPVSVDLGIKEQKTGTITFKETQPEMFQDGSKIVISIDDIGMDSRSAYTASVKTDGQSGLEVSSPKLTNDGNLEIYITEESDEIPGTITIENMQYDIWAGTPRGGYDLKIGGNALDIQNTNEKPFDKSITVKDYLNVGVNLVSSVEVITAQINFNSGTTVVNGQTQRPMTPPMMLNGWAMIGVRDIASFFGIPQDKIAAFHDENGIMTITIVNGTIGETGSTLVTVRNESKILTVNGTPVIMGQPMTISDDNHAYVPIRPIAEALGLHVYWNDATRVATVSTAFIQ